MKSLKPQSVAVLVRGRKHADWLNDSGALGNGFAFSLEHPCYRTGYRHDSLVMLATPQTPEEEEYFNAEVLVSLRPNAPIWRDRKSS